MFGEAFSSAVSFYFSYILELSNPILLLYYLINFQKARKMSTTISRAELERMKQSTLPPETDRSREISRKKRKELSDDKLKHWPNTLEALRKKKESFIKDREAQLESERQVVDLQV